jgi:hypothetical protein
MKGQYYNGDRITQFLDTDNGMIGDIVINKLERILIDFFPKGWHHS